MLQYREVHGYRRAYRMAGEGPPLLLLHGIADSSGTWSQVMPALAEHYTVIAPDLLGHGESARPRADYAIAAYACGMRDLLTVLGVDRVSVVGHSLGGGVAMQFGYQFPERCERLVLVSSAGMGPEVHPMFRLAAGPGAFAGMYLLTSPLAQAVAALAEPVVRLAGGGGLGPDLPYVMDRYRRFADAAARRAFLRTVRAAVDLRGQHITMLDRGYLARHLPTLIIWGGRDRIIPVAHAAAAHEALTDSRLEIFEASGHFPHHHEPDRFAAVVLDFLHTTDPADYDRSVWREELRNGPPPATVEEPSSGS
ncbi:alpha/beta hydrolase [Streptomyces sp. A7024]|uniref:Alpha/beta hydrolase n=1 Tax=Streptomyces coryli TaxID=1128680 RepID=A0A6G4U8W3_9ACTN|nr:alpha/beta hydrolase [Streptomyces coryli]